MEFRLLIQVSNRMINHRDGQRFASTKLFLFWKLVASENVVRRYLYNDPSVPDDVQHLRRRERWNARGCNEKHCKDARRILIRTCWPTFNKWLTLMSRERHPTSSTLRSNGVAQWYRGEGVWGWSFCRKGQERVKKKRKTVADIVRYFYARPPDKQNNERGKMLGIASAEPSFV